MFFFYMSLKLSKQRHLYKNVAYLKYSQELAKFKSGTV